MDRKEIEDELNKQVDDLILFLKNHPDSLFDQSKRLGKWTTGQHVAHLVKSSQLLNKAMRLPKFILSWRFGKMNRAERTYPELIKRYKEKLAVAPVTFAGSAPGEIRVEHKVKLIAQLDNQRRKLLKHFKRYSEKQMSQIIIPHPLLGKLSVREMMYFTAYHTLHHHQILKEHY